MNTFDTANTNSLSPGTWPVAATLAPSLSDADMAGSRGMPGEGAVCILANEVASDVASRDALLDRAMGPRWRRKSSEKLRRGRLPAEGLALVARDEDGAVVGTVRLWNVMLGAGGPPALLLGPLAVDPAMEGAGIGSRLMRHAIEEAGRLGHCAILLVGDAPYYGRFGFSAEKTGTLAMPGPFEKHRLLGLELVDGALDGVSGTIQPAGRRVRSESVRRAA